VLIDPARIPDYDRSREADLVKPTTGAREVLWRTQLARPRIRDGREEGEEVTGSRAVPE
jgi:hypothetical protein